MKVKRLTGFRVEFHIESALLQTTEVTKKRELKREGELTST